MIGAWGVLLISWDRLGKPASAVDIEIPGGKVYSRAEETGPAKASFFLLRMIVQDSIAQSEKDSKASSAKLDQISLRLKNDLMRHVLAYS